MKNSFTQVLLIALTLCVAAQAKTTLKDSKKDLQLFYNGFFEKVDLPHPTTLLSCHTPDTAQLTLDYYGDAFKALANNNIVAITLATQTYNSKLPLAVQACLSRNQELQDAFKAYGVQNKTLIQMVIGLAQFAASHYAEYHATLVLLDEQFTQNDFVSSGKTLGQVLLAAFKP